MLNQPAPTFTLTDQNNATQNLSDYRGKWLVVYFYPKDGTPLCTAEACSFRNYGGEIAQLQGAQVLGISQDSVEDHKEFAAAHKLNFPLLSDVDLSVTKAYGCYQPPDTPNREYLGIIRSTFPINPEGIVVKEYRGVNPDGHVERIISDLGALQSRASHAWA